MCCRKRYTIKRLWGYSKVDWITYFRCVDARFRRYLCKIDGLQGSIGNTTFPKVATTDHRRYRPIPIGGTLQTSGGRSFPRAARSCGGVWAFWCDRR